MKFLSILFLIASFLANAQERYTIIGNVSELKTNIPLPFVNVYIEGTSIGTQTNQKGGFSLNNISKGNHRLVASMVGFEPFVQNISILDKNINLQILLKEDIKALNEVKVVGVRDKVWEKHYKEFVREFLGNNYNAKEVKILNKEVLDFDIKEKSFTAQAIQPLVIENLTLGYKISYILQSFEKKGGSTAYKGLAKYDFIETQNEKQKAYWEKNRIESYQGSVKHFLNAVINNRLKEEGFKAFLLNPDSTHSSKTPTYTELKINDILSYTTIPDEYKLTLNKSIMIVYENDHIIPQFSKITQLSKIIVNKRGDLFDPYSVSVSGDIGEKRFANLLPTDFEINENDNNTITQQTISTFLPHDIEEKLSKTREKISITGLHAYYLAGEKISIQAFVSESNPRYLSTNTPSKISVPLYIELIDLAQGKLLKRYILKLVDGNAKVVFPTPFMLSTGNYQIRAYTNWMRNFSEESFFKQNITIFSQNYKNELASISQKTIFDTLSIHVEGGHLIDGLKSKIAIQTKDIFGEKMNINFQVINKTGDILINSETDSLGIATFELVPQANETYKIIVQNKLFYLPIAQPNGIVFNIDNISNREKIRVFIQTSPTHITSELSDSLSLLLIKDGQLVYWKKFQINKSTLLFTIPKNGLIGKIHCFLVTKNGEELGERIIEILPNQTTYNYLTKDNELLCEPYSHFLYFDKTLKFSPEKGISITGSVNRLNGKDIKKEIKISMILSATDDDSSKSVTQTFTKLCKTQFVFQDLDFYGKKKATFIAPNNRIELDSALTFPTIFFQKLPVNWKLLHNNDQKIELDKRKEKLIIELLEKKEQTEKTIILNEVVVSTKKREVDKRFGISPDFLVSEDKIMNWSNISSLLNQIRSRYRRYNKVALFLDTIQIMNPDEVSDINPLAIEKIMVFTDVSGTPLAGSDGAACTIVLVTKRGVPLKKNLKTNESFIIEGYNK